MSQYTTGEVAKLCGVSVRTVQYYDTRQIVQPSTLTDGGRRLYSEDDVKRMRIVCFLRETGLPLNSIAALLSDEHPEQIVSVLLEQQEQLLREELNERQEQLTKLEMIRRELKSLPQFSVESIGDIAYFMENKKQLRRLRMRLLLVGIPPGLLQWVAIILGVLNGWWWMLAVWAVVAVPTAVWMTQYYNRHVAYICPHCHERFSVSFKELMFSNHTPKMRRLTCPSCKHKGWCVEVYANKKGVSKDGKS